MFHLKIFVAEFIGIFAFVFVGVSAAMTGAGLLAVALAYGFTLAIFTYAYGYISGAHFNPAVTFGLALHGRIQWGRAIVSYMVPQFLGAFCAAFLLSRYVGDISAGATTGTFAEHIPMRAMAVEAFLTFLLVNSILHTSLPGYGRHASAWTIGMTMTVCILAGGALTGASLNPARTFGIGVFTALSFTNVYTYIVYFFGPLIGSTLAVMAYNFFNGGIAEHEETSAPEKEPAAPMPAKKSAGKSPKAKRK